MGFSHLKSIFKFPKRNVFECILPFLYFGRMFNYVNYSFVGKFPNTVLKIKASNIITFIFYQSFYMTYLVLLTLKGPETYNSYLMDTGNHAFLVIFYISSTISTYVSYFTIQDFWNLVKECYEVDQILEQFGIVTIHQKHFISMFKYCVVQIVSFFLINTISIVIYQSSMLQNFIPFGNMCICFASCIICVSVVFVRFESINKCLM